MSKLKDLVSRGVRLIIADTEESEPRPEPADREIPAEAFEEPPDPVPAPQVPADVEDFSLVYREAGVEPPAHGYGVEKVATMLENPRLAPLAREVRATAVLAALETAGVAVRDVIQDAVRRDRVLDAFESAKQQELAELRTRSEARVRELLEAIDAFVKAKNAEIESLKQAVASATGAFAQLQGRKRAEEERLHDIVSHFIEGADSPISRAASPPPPPRHGGGSS